MAIIKNKYKDRVDQRIKDFPNGIVPSDFTKRIAYDTETLNNPTILRTPRYGDDLDTTAFSALVADLVYNDTVLNEDGKKHNYLYSNGVIKNYKKEFEVYEKNLFQVLASYKINQFLDNNQFSLFVPNSIESNFANNVFCKMYFYTESQRLLSEYDFFYKEFTVSDIITMTNSTPAIYTDDYSVITFDGQISIVNADLLPDETIGIVLYLPTNVRNTTPYKSKNYINYIKIGNGALKIGDIFVDIKKDTYLSRSVINDANLNQIKIKNITETKFKDSFRTRRDILIAYYDQAEISQNLVFDGKIDLIMGDEKINRYSPLDSQTITTPRIKKIEYLTVNSESFHRVHLDDLSLLKGLNNDGDEILFRKINQPFTIRESVGNVFDGEYIIKNINYTNKTIDFVHPTFNGNYFQLEDTDNTVGYYGHIVPNIYVLYSFLIYKDNDYDSETQIQQTDSIFGYTGLESGVTGIEKTVLEINSNNFFEVSKNNLKHLKNFNNNLLEYDDAQSLDVPSVTATSFTLNPNLVSGDYILNKTEQQLPNEYDEIGTNSLSNSHFIIAEDSFNVINNSRISLSEINLGIKNSLNSIGTEGIKIKIESIEMLYALDDPRRISLAEAITTDTEYRFTLFEPDTNIAVNDILFISNNKYFNDGQYFYGNGDYQTAKIKRIEGGKIVINKIESTFTANFKINYTYPIYFNIIKQNGITKICESLLTNEEVKNQVINGFNGKFAERNSYSKIKFDRFIENIDPNDNSLKNGITLSQARDFKLDINKYYFISVAGFVMNNVATTYSSILIEDHNASDALHFKKSIYYEINIKSFKGRYPNSLIVSDEFGDINVFNINRTFSPFFRSSKYSIMAYDFSNLSVSVNDIPLREDIVLFDPISGRFKFHPNSTPSKIYLSYYITENLSGASDSENFIYKKDNDGNDTLRGKIQEIDNNFIYGTSFKAPISINGLSIDDTLDYKGPFKIKNNEIKIKNSTNFVDLDINKYDIEIDKNSYYEIIDLEKNILFLKDSVVEKENELQSINRQFLDHLTGQDDKNYYDKPTLNKNEEVIFNISEDTTIDQNLLATKKWQETLKSENNIAVPFLTNKKFNKIIFNNFHNDLIINCYERTKIENLSSEKININDLLKEFVYRKLNEKNYRYALKDNYTEDATVSFNDSSEIKQLNKTLVKDNHYFNKSEMVSAFVEQEDNFLIKRDYFEYANLNINKINTNNFIIINEHIINFDFKQINKDYTANITFSSTSLSYNQTLPSSNLVNGRLYFFNNAGYNSVLEKTIEIGDFIVRDVPNSRWDFYKNNDLFNISKINKNEDLSYSLSDFNDINIRYSIDDFDNSLQKLFLGNEIIKQNILKINENVFAVFILIKNISDIYSLYVQFFELADDQFFYPKKIDGDNFYLKIATSQISSDLIKIDKNNLYYNFLTLDDNRIVFCIMSLEGFIFKYLYLDDLTIDDGMVFINNKNIKNEPKLIKLNNEIFSIIFNSENSLNYDSSIGDLEIKIFNIENKNNIIFSYRESSTSYSQVDKIIINSIKNLSHFNYLKMSDDKLIIFYSKTDSYYLNDVSLNAGEWSADNPLANLNCFKTISFLKNENGYVFETSNQRTVFYQNINEAIFSPKIYPFKITSNIFGINYIQSDLTDTQTGNRLYTYNIDGVLQNASFVNDTYSIQNPESIKYIYSFNNRQAIEFNTDKVVIHNFNNDYLQLLVKEDIDYKKYFSSVNYNTVFQNKTSNPIEIKTVKDINGNVYDKKIITYFTKVSNIFKLNIGLVDNFNIDFSTIASLNVSPDNGDIVEEDGYIFYQNDFIYLNNKIYLLYTFLVDDSVDGNTNRLFIYLVNVSSKLNNNNLSFEEMSDFTTINDIKRDTNDNKNKFFFNKIANDTIEIICLRKINVNAVDSNLISKFSFKLLNEAGGHEFLESRGIQGYTDTDQTVDYIVAESTLFIKNIYKINYNDKIKCIGESYKSINDIDNYTYFYIKQDDFQVFNFFSLVTNNFNINYNNYNVQSEELLLVGDSNDEVVDYIFDFKTNLYVNEVIDTIGNNIYSFFKIEDTDKNCLFYYKINDTVLDVKILSKKDNENLLLAYENSYDYEETISDIAFNNYVNVYETFVKFPNSFVRSTWEVFPMNNISNAKNILKNEIYENRVDSNSKYKNIFSYSSINCIVGFNNSTSENYIYIMEDEDILKKIYENISGLYFYCNNEGNLCVFSVGDKNVLGYYDITYLIGESNKSTLLFKRVDFNIYHEDTYSFYKKSYQSSALKIDMFNYKGVKKNEYEVYRKNNYFYDKNDVYENIYLHKSNVYIIKSEYKDFQIFYNIKDDYENTAIYVKKYLIINNFLYSFENKSKILIDEYDNNDDINFICEKLEDSNIFISFKNNNNYLHNFILNKDYGFEHIDPDFTKKELYKFITINDKIVISSVLTTVNVLERNDLYNIQPYVVKRLFNGYLLFLIKITNNETNITKIAHILYKEDGFTVDYYNNDYNKIYELIKNDEIIGYSEPNINSFGYTSLFIYKNDSSKDILQFGIDGEGGICKLKGITNLF